MTTATHRKSDLAVLMFAVVSGATAGPIMAVTAAPSLAIAFWRNAFAAIVLLPMLLRHRRAYAALGVRQWRALIGAGVLLGVHFSCWVPSVRLTTVAAAQALVSTQVVWAAVLERLSGRRTPRMQFVGIVVTLLGVLWLTGVDFAVSPANLAGDGLALVAAMIAASYLHVGRGARPSLPLSAYTAVLYFAASSTLLVICLVRGVTLTGYPVHAWVLIGAVTLFANFGGHTLYNRALRSFSVTAVSNFNLLQIPVSALLAWIVLSQTPRLTLLPAGIALAAGVIIVVLHERPQELAAESMPD